MNTIIKTALILIGVGVLMLILSFVLVRGNLNGYNSKGNDSIEQTFESGTDIEEIDIDGSAGSLIFQTADTDIVTIDYYDNPEKPNYEVVEKDGKLTFRRIGSTFKLININFSVKDIVITLPSDYAGILDVDLSGGSIEADDISAGQISFDNSAGSYKLKNITSLGNVDIKNSSGSIEFENLKAGGDITIYNTAGSIEGTIVGSKSDYTIVNDVTAGSSNLDNTTGGSKKLNAMTTAGSIEITFTE